MSLRDGAGGLLYFSFQDNAFGGGACTTAP